MNRLPAVIAIAGGVMATSVMTGLPAFGADSTHTLPSKRQFVSQVINCMRKRMAVDKNISYNQAAKFCKDEVTRLAAGPDSGTLVADTKH